MCFITFLFLFFKPKTSVAHKSLLVLLLLLRILFYLLIIRNKIKKGYFSCLIYLFFYVSWNILESYNFRHKFFSHYASMLHSMIMQYIVKLKVIR